MTQIYGQPDYSRIERRSRLYDSGIQVLYFPILLIPTSHHDGYWSRMFRIAVQNDINIPMAGDLTVEQPWLFWGTERTEKGYYSWPHILDFHFILLSWKRSHVYRSTVIQFLPQTHNNIAMTDNLAVKPLWLFMSKRKQWGVRFPGPASRCQLLNLHSTNHRMCWSTVSQMVPDN